jgi:hypothetical protein
MQAGPCLASIGKTQQDKNPVRQERTMTKIGITFEGKSMAATLDENPSARDRPGFRFCRWNSRSTTTATTRKSPTCLANSRTPEAARSKTGSATFARPLGQLVFYYGDYRYSRGLIRLGRFDDSVEPLLTRGKFPLRIEQVSLTRAPQRIQSQRRCK